MKILLDENLPVRLCQKLAPFQVYHVKEMGWSGIKNGKLLQKAVDDGFTVFITADKNLPYQQNISIIEISVFILNVFRLNFAFIEPLVPNILKQLENVETSKVYQIEE